MAIIAPKLKPIQEEETGTRFVPPYAVIVLNDDYHTFEYVICVFQKVFGYSLQKAILLAQEIHKQGRGHRLVRQQGSGGIKEGAD